MTYPLNISLRPGHPDFLDLPWDFPLAEWDAHSSLLAEVPRGLSRHTVVFVNYGGILYAIKELPPGVAEKEYDLLMDIDELNLPAVQAVGHVQMRTRQVLSSALITQYLDHSLPFRWLFMSNTMDTYREHLLDAMAGLLVQLHLAGVYWGDCSLSNTLFRRDIGALRAYLVDAETAEIPGSEFPPEYRFHDLEIMEDNVNADLVEMGITRPLAEGVPITHTGAYIRLRYDRLWEEITREDIIGPGEHFRIQERIRALNQLGFSVGEVELAGTEDGDQLRLRVVVTDRNFHRDQLLSLIGVEAEENQAQKIMNEIHELNATLAQRRNRNSPLSVAAYYWLENLYEPTLARLAPLIKPETDVVELYCQVLEHKWYLSERERRDVGHEVAAEDYKNQFYLSKENIANT
ncbi:MAG TPA: DUF4032 domain-containing protein [Anaerolineales bacterium]|nr:DUF4032 domain-containing protein [Anaerolineales bacterium]